MSSEYRVTLVGCGVIGKHHANVLNAHPAYKVTQLVDTETAKAHEIASKIAESTGESPSIYESLSQALHDNNSDIVVINTPSGTHIDLAEQAISAKKHVVIEKPIDVNLERARNIVKLAEKAALNNQIITVISQHRFDPATVIVKNAIDEGKLGKICSAIASVAWWRTQEYYDSGDWRGTWELDGGGAVMNQGVHTVDLLRLCLGEPDTIYAETALLAHERIEVEDTAVATVKFKSGSLGLIHCTTSAYPGLSAQLSVYGSKGSAVIDNDKLSYYHAMQAGESASGDGMTRLGNSNQASEVISAQENNYDHITDEFLAGHYRQYDDIAEAISTQRKPGVTAKAALKSLALVKAMYISAQLGKVIKFDDVLNGKYDDVEFVVNKA